MTTLVRRLASSVERFTDREAIKHRGRSVSYEALWNQATRVGALLQSEGLERGARVAILCDNSPEFVAGYYGAQMAGGAVVALNTQAKAREVLRLIAHCQASWVIVDAQHREARTVLAELPSDVRVLVIGSELDEVSNERVRTIWHWADLPDSQALKIVESRSTELGSIIYTSGTTGHPKGVMLTQDNLDSNMQGILRYLDLGDDDRLLCVLPFYYTYGNSVLHTHLAVGGSLVLENSSAFPQVLLEHMQNENATGFSGVPSTFALLLGRTNLGEFDLSRIRYMTQAGGPMPPALVQRLKNHLPDISFFVMYGQTEATARITYLPADRLEDKLGSVGIPVEGVEISIRDERGFPVDAGKSGEICVKGRSVMQGYWADPEATEKVIRDGWLHTGDLGHFDDDGFIYIDGRSSEMIKSGANRISPKEIEEVLCELEDVMEAAVVGIADDILGQVIKAVVVRRPGSEIDRMTILKYCRENLAGYKVPKKVEFVEELPKTASGKIRRFLLAENEN